ncbi:hypothetical protein HPB47_010725 [Ixodes persulcatus]|uniref:Uncharacterized protein n=1 Tax=Ixodes persulcatus TaxID=34615 RepID=A0AC60NYA4_IXOPE|nr:hypothetical protein HPB47_010725 [Ixodes persulcatus]
MTNDDTSQSTATTELHEHGSLTAIRTLLFFQATAQSRPHAVLEGNIVAPLTHPRTATSDALNQPNRWRADDVGAELPARAEPNEKGGASCDVTFAPPTGLVGIREESVTSDVTRREAVANGNAEKQTARGCCCCSPRGMTRLVNHVEALLQSAQPNSEDLELLIERLVLEQGQLNTTDATIEPLISE